MGEGEDVVKTRMRAGLVALALCAVGTVLWLVPVASAGAAISGTVTDEAVQPLQGIEVCAVSTGPLGSETCSQTDASGKYSISAANAGSLVHFTSRENLPPGYAPQWYPGKAFSEEAEGVPAADTTHVDATMTPGGTVTGMVLSTEGSTPIKGVEVCPDPVVFRDREVTWCDKTDTGGEFALRGLSTADYRFEFRTEGKVNYVEELTPPRSIQAGTESNLEAHLVPGVMVEGTLTEAGTGVPIEFLAGYSTPSICALEAETEARIKCAWVGQEGHYALPGLPPGKRFGVAFAKEWVEEGFDLHPDGYVRQYWDHVPTWQEAAIVSGTAGSVFAGVDAALTRGDEVFPHCEVWSACPPPADPDPPSADPGPLATNPGPTTGIPSVSTPLSLPCRKGFRKVQRGAQTQCVKVHQKKHRKRHRHHG